MWSSALASSLSLQVRKIEKSASRMHSTPASESLHSPIPFFFRSQQHYWHHCVHISQLRWPESEWQQEELLLRLVFLFWGVVLRPGRDGGRPGRARVHRKTQTAAEQWPAFPHEAACLSQLVCLPQPLLPEPWAALQLQEQPQRRGLSLAILPGILGARQRAVDLHRIKASSRFTSSRDNGLWVYALHFGCLAS